MSDYTPTQWVDHFADPVTGEVYQEGTSVDAEHLNHIEQGVSAAHEHMGDEALHLAAGERTRWDAMTPQTRTVNGKPLTGSISLTAADVGARPSTWMPTAADVGARPASWTPGAADTGAVPTSRKINGKPLSADVTLAAADVGARPSNWTPGLADCGGTLAIGKGGTGATTVAAARNALGLGNTAGAVPVANGGTGQTTAAGIRNSLGLGNTTGVLPIANGGTGQNTAAKVRNALGLGNTTGALPVANGGTGISNLVGTDYGTTRVRGIYAGTGDMTPGSTALANGVIYLMYE